MAGWRRDGGSAIIGAVNSYNAAVERKEIREYDRDQAELNRAENADNRAYARRMDQQDRDDRRSNTEFNQGMSSRAEKRTVDSIDTAAKEKTAMQDGRRATTNALIYGENEGLDRIDESLKQMSNIGSSNNDSGGSVKADGSIVVNMNDKTERPMTYDGSENGTQIKINPESSHVMETVMERVSGMVDEAGGDDQQKVTAVRSALSEGEDGYAVIADADTAQANRANMSKFEKRDSITPGGVASAAGTDLTGIREIEGRERPDYMGEDGTGAVGAVSDVVGDFVDTVGWSFEQAGKKSDAQFKTVTKNAMDWLFGKGRNKVSSVGKEVTVSKTPEGKPKIAIKVTPSKLNPEKDGPALEKARTVNIESGVSGAEVETAQLKQTKTKGNKQLAAALAESYALGDPSVTLDMVKNANETGNPSYSQAELTKMGLQDRKLVAEINKLDRQETAEKLALKMSSKETRTPKQLADDKSTAFKEGRRIRKESIKLAFENMGVYDKGDFKDQTTGIAQATKAFDLIFEQLKMDPEDMQTWGGNAAIVNATEIFHKQKQGAKSMAGAFAASLNGFGVNDSSDFMGRFNQLATVAGGEGAAFRMMSSLEYRKASVAEKEQIMNSIIVQLSKRQ